MSSPSPTTAAPASVMVTGGCGFIASNFVNHIGRHWPTARIVNFDKLVPGANACNIDQELREADRYTLVIGDQLNRALVIKTLEKYQIDTVVNFAANSHVDDCYRDPIGCTENNVLGMTHFMEACRAYGKLKRFVHISSDEVYGDSGLDEAEVPKPEHTLLTPTNVYSATKASCEAILNAYRISYSLPTVLLRMNNVYGPRQWDCKVVPRFIKEAVEGTPFTLMGDGSYLRSWMFVEDCVRGIRMLTEKGELGEIYNLGTHFELSIRELSVRIHNEVARQTSHPIAPYTTIRIPDRPYNDRRYFIDTTKVETEIGWKTEVPFDEGLRRTVEWYLRPHKEVMNEHVLIYGGRGWIGQQFQQLLKSNGVSYALSNARPGDQADKLVEEELLSVAPSHVVSFLGRTHGPGSNTIEYLEGGPDKLKENAQDNMYAPWLLASMCHKLGIHMTYVGTGCIYAYDQQHPIDGVGYTEEDEPNYFGNSYSVMKGHTDRMMHHFDNVFNVRIRLPINFSTDKRNLIVKVASYKQIYDVPNSITILPDILPIMLDLMQKRYAGTLNMTNPGPVRHSQTLALYNDLVEQKQWQIISDDQPEAERMRQSRANCALDTTKLQAMYPNIRPAIEGIREAILQVAHGNGKISDSKLKEHGFTPVSLPETTSA